MGTAQFAIENLGRNTLSDSVEAMLMGLAVAILVIYWVYARDRESPVLDLKMFRVRTFSIAVLAGSVIRAGIATVPFLLPLLLQVGFGLTPFQSGLITFLNTAGAMSMRAWVRHLVRRFGFRAVFVSGVFLVSGLMAGMALFEPTTPHLLIAGYLFVFGVLRSAQMIGMSALAYSDVPDEHMSKATSIFALGQRLSQSLGVGISATLLTLLAAGRPVTLVDFKIVFVAIALLMASSAFGFRRLKPDDGWQVSGYKGAAG
jgi:MFS family permease